MIAGKENDQHRIAGEILQAIRFSIRGREAKGRGAVADLQGKAHLIS
jgi:hypothetical protein